MYRKKAKSWQRTGRLSAQKTKKYGRRWEKLSVVIRVAAVVVSCCRSREIEVVVVVVIARRSGKQEVGWMVTEAQMTRLAGWADYDG